MKILNLQVIIAVMVAAFTLLAAEEGKHTGECSQSGTLHWDVKYFNPNTGLYEPVTIIYKLDEGKMEPTMKVVCLHLATGGDEGTGKHKSHCPTFGDFIYDANHEDATTKEKTLVNIAFKLSKSGTMDPKVKITCIGKPSNFKCPVDGTFIDTEYRTEPTKTIVKVSYKIHNGIFNFEEIFHVLC